MSSVAQVKASTRTGGQAVVEALLNHNVQRVYCVPGESYLAVLDALYDVDDRIRLISCRHESGAAMMAAAHGHLTGSPGVCFVTRGPGATNASIAIHIARQASLPMVLGVGQVARAKLGREAFQEVDYAAYFGGIAKHVRQVEDADAIPAAMADAFEIAQTGRPGPVVVAFPEDVLLDATGEPAEPPHRAAPRDISRSEMERLKALLARAERPLVIAGGTQWSDAACKSLVCFAEHNRLPVCCAFRRQDLFDNRHPCYVGYLGLSAHPALWEYADDADCVIVLGARLDEPTTRGYRLLSRDDTARSLIHVYPGDAELGLNHQPDLAIRADIPAVVATLRAQVAVDHAPWDAWCDALRAAYLDSADPRPGDARLDLGAVMNTLNDCVGDDAIITLDAGNFTRWPQRFRRYRRPGRLVAPINGAMGYGVPAAIAAALNCPQRQVIGCVGDGGMLMTGMELATAMQYGATPTILVFNNQKYGTIETHQEARYPGRRIGTSLVNPDFVAFARSFGAFGAKVSSHDEFEPALRAALAADTAAVIELTMNTAVGQ